MGACGCMRLNLQQQQKVSQQSYYMQCIFLSKKVCHLAVTQKLAELACACVCLCMCMCGRQAYYSTLQFGQFLSDCYMTDLFRKENTVAIT